MEDISLSIIGISCGIGAFGWYFYNNSRFRRCVIEKSFDYYDYLYSKYSDLRYDDKIRINDLLPKNFKNHQLEFKGLKLVNENNENNQNNENSEENKIELLEFYSDKLRYEYITLREKDYYILGSKNKNELQFSENIILNMNWLAISISIEKYDKNDNENENENNNNILECDITSTFNKYWLLGNQIPFSVNYYDVWISNILKSSISNVPRMEEIKKLKLIIIDNLGDFKEYENILIIPEINETRIIKL